MPQKNFPFLPGEKNPIRSHDRLPRRIRERERNRTYEYPPCLVRITSRPNLSSCYGPLEKFRPHGMVPRPCEPLPPENF